ncbi:MAG: YcaO-like family protein [Burkholderiales bacterium]|nr:YcaO-like family protein [Burkholderiales bacterium]
MQTESFIPGKDASLESAIRTMQQKLAARGFHLDEFFERLETHYFWTHFYLYVSNGMAAGNTLMEARTQALSEIYPVEDLAWENNSVGNQIRPALVRLPALSDAESRALLAAYDKLFAAAAA